MKYAVCSFSNRRFLCVRVFFDLIRDGDFYILNLGFQILLYIKEMETGNPGILYFRRRIEIHLDLKILITGTVICLHCFRR